MFPRGIERVQCHELGRNLKFMRSKFSHIYFELLSYSKLDFFPTPKNSAEYSKSITTATVTIKKGPKDKLI